MEAFAASDQLPPLSEALTTASAPYVGQWNRLVSTTNWQKGRIIGQWRESLAAQGVAPAEYSDEAWARLVGGVSGQHAGRLRRVCARFGAVYEQYAGLYWSHFQAAVEWNDAEMWLEGAVASGWSVGRMRDARWETLGQLDGEQPREGDVVFAEMEEGISDFRFQISDGEPSSSSSSSSSSITGSAGASPSLSELRVPRSEDEDDKEHDEEETAGRASRGTREQTTQLVQPFADLPELPDDLAEAVEALKLAVLRHKSQEWREISAGEVLRVLEAIKELVTAPSGEPDNAN